MFAVLKISCLVIYALGAAGALGLLPESLSFFGVVALLLLAAHVAEVFLMFKHVRRYQGPLAVSILLTVLFGLLHWKPLADQAARDAAVCGEKAGLLSGRSERRTRARHNQSRYWGLS